VWYQRIDELDAVVFGRIVARCDHDANGLAIEFPGPEGSEEADAEDDRVEEVASGAVQLKAPVNRERLTSGNCIRRALHLLKRA
jgi:hypothetical protein